MLRIVTGNVCGGLTAEAEAGMVWRPEDDAT